MGNKNKESFKSNSVVSLLTINEVIGDPFTVMIIDANGYILDVSCYFEQLTGYSRNEIIGQNARIFKSGKVDPKIYKQMWEKVLKGGIWKGELLGKKKNGGAFDLELTISPFENLDPKGINFIGIGRDITREKKNITGLENKSKKLKRQLAKRAIDIKALLNAEAAVLNMMEDLNETKDGLERKVKDRTKLLQKSEQRYKALIEKATDGIIMVDEKGAISIWNNEAKKMFGYSAKEIIGENVEIIVAGEQRERYRVKLNAMFKAGNWGFIGKTIELEGLKKNGLTFPIEVSFSYEKGNPGKSHFMAIVRDITERKIMEKHMLQTEKLKSIGELAAGVAHEINNPLAIMGIDLILMNEKFPKSHSFLEHIHSLTVQQQRIAGIVKGLQEISRPVSSPIKKIEINKIFQDHIVSIALKKLKKNNVLLEFFLKNCQGFVKASRSQLTQVFLNMIHNAEAAMEEKEIKIKKGSLKIKNYKKKLKISTQLFKENSQLIIEFADNGIGIEEKYIKNIFNPFFSTKGFHGTGLGLSISYNIIKSFDGVIKVQSQPVVGTSFKIGLPTRA